MGAVIPAVKRGAEVNAAPTKGTMNRTLSYGLVAAYLGAIVAANLTTARWGPTWSVYNAFLLVGLALTTRDRLHDLWGSERFRNMALLIVAGSALSYGASIWLTPDSVPSDVVAKIALASCVAFFFAEGMDALSYEGMLRKGWPWFERANASNVVGAVFDSVIFVCIAFGWNWSIIFGQITAKIAGGFVWSFVLAKHRERQTA